jgi:hypothetical protein
LFPGLFTCITVPRSAFLSLTDGQAFAEAAMRIKAGDISPLKHAKRGAGQYAPKKKQGGRKPAPGQRPYLYNTPRKHKRDDAP